MKRNLLLFVFFLLLSTFIVQAQIVPNKSFETWKPETLYEEPDMYWTSNGMVIMESFGFGQPNATKSTDAYSGNHSLKLTTVFAFFENIPGIASNGTITDGDFWGGSPISEKPDSFVAHVKYEMNSSDTGFILIIFKNSGFPLSQQFYPIYGTSTNWTRISFPLQKPVLTPDSVFVAFLSGNPDETNTAGSYIMIDDVSFVGSTAQLPNPGFEDWNDVSFEDPEGWFSFNRFIKIFGGVPNATKSTDAYDGNYAISIKTALFGDDQDADTIGFIATTSLENIESGVSGFALNKRPDSLVFSYQYKPNGIDDNGIVMMIMSKYNSTTMESEMIDSNFVYLDATTGYTMGSVTFNSSGSQPDSANIIMASSNFLDEVGIALGSELIVDNMLLYFGSVGIPFNDVENNLSVYPNPANDHISLDLSFAGNGKLSIDILDISGKLVKSADYEVSEGHQALSINTSELAEGNYLLKLQFENEKPVIEKFSVLR